MLDKIIELLNVILLISVSIFSFIYKAKDLNKSLILVPSNADVSKKLIPYKFANF
jgi:hypothetical protein